MSFQSPPRTADLVLVLGTSLSGLTADCVAKLPAARSERGKCLGSVMMNLQQTAEDGIMSLRMFGRSDDLLKMLLEELRMGPVPMRQPSFPHRAAQVPYDRDGVRLRECGPMMWLDLSDGQKVRITPGHNIQGARQPHLMHIVQGLGKVVRRKENYWMLNIEGRMMELGLWWMEAAMRGAVEVLPVVNQEPRFEERAKFALVPGVRR